MTFGAVTSGRVLAGFLAAALGVTAVAPAPILAAPTDPDLVATLELPAGEIDYRVELGTVHYFDREDVPFVVQVLDGCSVNDHLWLFGAGLSDSTVPLTMLDLRSGRSQRIVLPAFMPGDPVGSVLEPEALAVCGDEPTGGLPPLSGRASFTAAGGRDGDYGNDVRVLSDGQADGYRRIVREGLTSEIISRGSPVAAVDTSASYDELLLIAEGRTPGTVEGVVFSGGEGMLPSRARLERALADVTKGRARRAFETAKNRRVPRAIIDDLGLGPVEQVHHVAFDFDSLGADAYLTIARWIRQRDRPVEPPQPVEERFSVEIVRADGERTSVPLVGPLEGSEADGVLWQYRSEDVLVEIIDACDLGGSFWTLAGATIGEPVELVVTDTVTGATATHVLWTDREEVARLSDTSAMGCR